MKKVTISTLDLAEVINTYRQRTGDKRVVMHRDLLKKARHNFGTTIEAAASDYMDSAGRKCKSYNLDKRQAVMMVTYYGEKVVDAVVAKMDGVDIETGSPVISAPAVVAQPKLTNDVTMTSLELVSFINSIRAEGVGFVELRHDSFIAKVRTVLGEAAQNFLDSFPDSTGRSLPMYRFPKREATLMAMSYSHKISAQVYDRMEELERSVAPAATPFQVPQTFTEALRIALAQSEKIDEQNKEIEQQQFAIAMADRELTLAAPKVQFHKKFVAANDLFTATDVAKKLSISAVRLNDWLDTKDVLFANRKHFKQWYIAKGYGVEKFTEVGNDVYSKFYHTNAGADWIFENYRG